MCNCIVVLLCIILLCVIVDGRHVRTYIGGRVILTNCTSYVRVNVFLVHVVKH